MSVNDNRPRCMGGDQVSRPVRKGPAAGCGRIAGSGEDFY